MMSKQLKNLNALLTLTEQILVLRGGPTSGNWSHVGRKGKRGGSGRGGGFKKIGVKSGKAGRGKIKQASRQTRAKEERKKQGGATGGDKKETREKQVPKSLEDTIGDDYLGAEFSRKKLQLLKSVDRNAYDKAIKTGINRMRNDLSGKRSDIKYFSSQLKLLKEQKDKAEKEGKKFNPLKENKLKQVNETIPALEASIKHLETELSKID